MPSRRGVGVVLAAGEGRRLGGPKALICEPGGQSWLERTVGALREGGADTVYVVVGAAADEVRTAAPKGSHVVEASGWREGMGASLRAGLAAVVAEQPDATVVVVMLVDTPGVGAPVVRRMLAEAGPESLRRATYDGSPSHPVVIGRDHWAGVIDAARGDQGARAYLKAHHAEVVECGQLGSGADIDTGEALDAWRESQPRGQ